MKLKGGISCEGMSPEWVAREGKKGDALIKAGMLETQGEVEEPLRLYAEAAAEEDALAKYCRSIGLHEKAFYHAKSGAHCWEKAGDLHTAAERWDALSQWDT